MALEALSSHCVAKKLKLPDSLKTPLSHEPERKFNVTTSNFEPIEGLRQNVRLTL